MQQKLDTIQLTPNTKIQDLYGALHTDKRHSIGRDGMFMLVGHAKVRGWPGTGLPLNSQYCCTLPSTPSRSYRYCVQGIPDKVHNLLDNAQNLYLFPGRQKLGPDGVWIAQV